MATSSPEAQDHRHTSLFSIPDRRRGVSDLARIEQILEHAVTYLVREQARRGDDSYHQAILIHCRGIIEIAAVERRGPARKSMRNWLKRIARLQEQKTS